MMGLEPTTFCMGKELGARVFRGLPYRDSSLRDVRVARLVSGPHGDHGARLLSRLQELTEAHLISRREAKGERPRARGGAGSARSLAAAASG
jgi:hypothetical protein